MIITLRKPVLALIFIIFGGFLSGTVNGLFGTGGGIITVYFLSNIPYFRNVFSKKDIFAMTLAASFMMSVSSAFFYIRSGNVAFSDITPYIIPAMLGGFAGALVLDKMKTSFLAKLFSVIVIYAGITLFTR